MTRAWNALATSLAIFLALALVVGALVGVVYLISWWLGETWGPVVLGGLIIFVGIFLFALQLEES
jgi:ABC-type xylose transport system permease subunit